MNNLPIPVTYQKACSALQECVDVDEVKDWVDKAAAMEVYAKQAEDETLFDMAKRIKLRAARRAGEMLSSVPDENRGRPKKNQRGSQPNLTRKKAALDAGISEHQRKQYQRIAAVPEEDFEGVVEAAKPPTLTALASGKVLNGHQSANTDDEWYTPAEYIEAARKVMGSIDCDPASNDFAQQTVKADTYFTQDNSGLENVWRGNVWLNPPYSKVIMHFAEHLFDYLEQCEVQQAIVLVNNGTDTKWFHRFLESASAICFVRGRIAFEKPQGTGNQSPNKGQLFLYYGARKKTFTKVFSEYGNVWIK